MAQLLAAEARSFSKLWRASPAPDACIPDRCVFEVAQVEEIRSAASSCPTGTAFSPEGLHPRHIALLPDLGHITLALILRAVE